jgi:HD-like signal output (HDOD) protein
MGRLIKQDPAFTAKLLQVASSAFFNTSATVADVESAIMRLGSRTLRNLSHALSGPISSRPSALPMITAVQQLQQRSLGIARLASGMARLPEDASSAYIAGLLCDVGQLVLVGTARQAEQAAWSVGHAEIGAYLLGLWGLPFQIVEAVANHHQPARSTDDRLGLAQLVWLASCIESGEEAAPELLRRFGAEELYATQRRAFQASET